MKVYKTEEWIERGKSMHIFSSKTSGAMPTHTHDFIEIVYVSSGAATQTVDGQAFEVQHGDMIFLNYGSTHSFDAHGEFRYINICFSPETVGQTIITPQNAFSLLSLTAFNEMCNESGGGKISFFGGERKEIEDILSAMLREYEAKQSAWHTVMESYLNILITRMLRKTELGVRDEEIGDVWRELSDFIDANLQAELTLSALASKCFYNPSYFSRAFKEKFRMSPVEYITRKRLQLAMRLLSETELSVDEILRQSGFSDRSRFYYAFSKYVGSTPSEYRKSCAKVKKSDK